ncbi:MAG TPA: outer membrane beta-barrel protein [Puia sp.]|uniref:outer membrane beta-barrel protein n=1 Tax=Puia sp. TaxID=2045100 RepID=UPI002BF08E81|nr:outer membrane beta-barrel protein [Puia sp.]HVU95514.1 outer membrane beta-barrel protein [Puia sp.]
MFPLRHFSLFLFLVLASLLDWAQGRPIPNNPRDTTLPRIDSLRAVIVSSKPRPRVKTDTVEYNTENMRLRMHATVEDMLGRLPGLRIDPSGAVYYNGEKIDKLLVDGEDIFASDPTLITRNFDGSKIARVQILNRKSDHARFTGIDDGTRTKTLNLIMKESEKNGYFGKGEAGGDTEGYHSADGFLAAFRDKEQFMVLGQAANTGAAGMDINGTGSGRIISYNIIGDPLGASAGAGIPRYEAAAAHYGNAWRDSKDHLTTNYQFSHSATEPLTTTTSVETLPGGIFGQSQWSASDNTQDQQLLYGMFDWASSKRTALEMTFETSKSNGINQLEARTGSSLNDTLQNSGERTIRDKVNGQHFNTGMSWRIGMGKNADHVLSFNFGGGRIDNVTDGYLYSLNRFYQNGGVQSQDTVDQRKAIASHTTNLGGGLNYAEPLWKDATLGFSYGAYLSGDKPLQASYGRNGGKYDLRIDSLSSYYQTKTVIQNAAIILQGSNKVLSYSIGNSWLGFSYRQQDLLAKSLQHWNYWNWAPRARLTYTPNPALSFVFGYSASTQQPAITQLQPVTNNSDPLHLTLGNPDLRPAFNQTIEWEFHRFKTWNLNISGNLALASNAISTKTTTDTLGRQVSQPVNVDGGRSVNFNLSVDRRFGDIDVSLHSNANVSRSVNYVNADLNRNTAFNGAGGVNLGRYVTGKYSAQLGANYGYFSQKSSVNASAPVHYWTQNYNANFSLFLIKDFNLTTNLVYNAQGRSASFPTSTSTAYWNAALGRNFLENRLEVRFQFNNILNSNAGIGRSNTGNIVTQTSTNILGRYWLLGAAYRFDHKWKRK